MATSGKFVLRHDFTFFHLLFLHLGQKEEDDVLLGRVARKYLVEASSPCEERLDFFFSFCMVGGGGGVRR